MKKFVIASFVLFFLPFTSFASTFSHTLLVGSSGTEVSQLQQFLIDENLFTATPSGYFGAVTKQAVAAFQSQEGITPQNGVFGPVTRADVNKIVAAHPEWTTTLSTSRTYTNVSGSKVTSPAYSSNGVPAGASAICGDGTYSFSMHHSGTCSHHGGVSQWLQ